MPLKTMDSAALAVAILEATGSHPQVLAAIGDATFLHRNQTRANRGALERTPYIEHPLRGGLRLIRWGVTDLDTVIASILHDTVEDGCEEILSVYLSLDPADFSVAEQRALAAGWLSETYGIGVTTIVQAVSNPPADKSLGRAQRNVQYVDHVRSAVAMSAKVFLVKFADYMDNGAGLYHNDTPRNRGMVRRLAAKYLPLADVFETSLAASPGVPALVSEAGLAEIRRKIITSRARLARLAAATAA